MALFVQDDLNLLILFQGEMHHFLNPYMFCCLSANAIESLLSSEETLIYFHKDRD